MSRLERGGRIDRARQLGFQFNGASYTGFAGDTLGSTTCALAMRGANGKWSVELEPGSVRLRNTSSGETLRFKQTGKAQKPA